MTALIVRFIALVCVCYSLISLWYKGFQGEFLIAISIGATLFALSFTTRSTWDSLLQLVSRGASAATPHASRAGTAVANSGSVMFGNLLRFILSSLVLVMGLLATAVCLYLFGSAFINHDMQKLNLGLVTLVYAVVCFITHFGWWGSYIRFTFGSKTKRNWTWLVSSVMILALSVLNGWVELGVVSAISTISAVVTIADGWSWVRKNLRKVLGAWLFDKGLGVGVLTWTLTGFITLIAFPVAAGLPMDSNLLYVLGAGAILAIIFGVPMVMKEKAK